MTQKDIIGAVLAVVGAVISNLGVNVQKFSHAKNERLPINHQRSYLRRPTWWCGLFLVISGSIADFTAFGFATQALVASLGGGSTLVANVVIAKYFNKEVLYKTDLIGVIFIVLGVVLIAAITDPDGTYTLKELEGKFIHQEFIIYISIVGLCTLSLLATIKGSYAHRLKKQLRWSRDRQKKLMKKFELRFHLMEDRITTLEDIVLTRAQDLNSNEKRNEAISQSTGYRRKSKEIEHVDDIMEGVASRDLVPYYYAICSGVVGAISVLFAKCSALLLALTLNGDNQFEYPLTYAFLGGMILCILIQTHLLNMATTLGDTMTVFPIFQAFWISFSVIGGIVFYETSKDFTTQKWILYPVALCLVGVGVLFLLQHERQKRRAAGYALEQTTRLENGLDSYDEYGLLLMANGSIDAPLLPVNMRNTEGY